jgi:hypothetical protein
MTSVQAPVGRALLFTAAGIPVAACIFTAGSVKLICHLVGRVWPLPRELLAYAVYIGLSLGIISIALRAWRRTRDRQAPSTAPWLARQVPWLLVVGCIAGLVFGLKFGLGDVAHERGRASHVCNGALGMTGNGPAIESCIPIALACRREREAAEDRPRVRKLGDEWFGDPWYECVKRRLAER